VKPTIGKWRGLQRISDGDGRFMMLAADQRPPIKNVIAKFFADGIAPYDEVARFKRLLVRTLQEQASAVLLDPYYCLSGALHDLHPSKGLVMTLEDSRFEETAGGRLSSVIDGWSVGKIKRMGADAVKVLAWYRPDAQPSVIEHQRNFVRQIGDECRRFDIPYLLELLVYPFAGEAEAGKGYEEMAGKKTEHVLDSIREFSDPAYGVDIFKLECPIASREFPAHGAAGSSQALALFEEIDRIVARPWVMLSAGASASDFYRVLDHACRAGASGFLAGRAIWQQAFAAYPDWSAIEAGLRREAIAYLERLGELTVRRAHCESSRDAISKPQARLAALKGLAVRDYPDLQ
jgi:tagatose 1,6-diphosphate aldolase